MDKRNRYSLGMKAGKHCLKIQTGAFFERAFFDKSKPPRREYMNWQEFKHLWMQDIT